MGGLGTGIFVYILKLYYARLVLDWRVSCRSTPYNLKSNGYLHGVGQGSRVLNEPWSEWPRKKLGGYRASIHVLTQTQTVKFKLTTHGDPRTLG